MLVNRVASCIALHSNVAGVSCARARVVAVKVHTEFFAAALSKRAIMEAWEGGKGGNLQT